MMNPKQAKQAHGDLVRRRGLVQQLMNKTREQMEELMETVKLPDAQPSDILRLQILTFQGKVLVGVMAKIGDEAAALALELKRAPITPNEINVPDTMPEEL